VDAAAKITGKPLFRWLAERHGGTADPRVFVYAAGGYYYPGKDLKVLRAEMRSYLDRGYTVVKMKIGGERSSTRPAADRSRSDGDREQAQLAVDANGRFNLETPFLMPRCCASTRSSGTKNPATCSIIGCSPRWQNSIRGSMATGENLFSQQDARNLIRHGRMRPDRDWLPFNCALLYYTAFASTSGPWRCWGEAGWS
jgi:D(-)-tartrate dehydratase